METMTESRITGSFGAPATEAEKVYLDRLSREERPTLAEYIRRVLDTDFVLHVPQRPGKTPYAIARKMLWQIISFRLQSESLEWKRDHFNTEVVQKLLCWFCGLEGEVGTPLGVVQADLPLSKGIWLSGPPGVGKTFIMECLAVTMAAVYQRRRCFRIVNMKSLEQKLRSSKDVAVLDKHFKSIWCLDDVGFEAKSNIYGNEVEPFETIINERYQRHESLREKTFVTSNYPMTDATGKSVVGQVYDERLARRVKAMFTEIRFLGEDKTS